jgi:amino acid adenylation domain-containing protein
MSKNLEHTQAKQQWIAQRLKSLNTKQSSSGITLQSRPPKLPLSFAQQRLWFLDQLEPGSTAYLMPYAWRLQGLLDAAALEASLTTLVTRHESLRTIFTLLEGDPVQVITPVAPVSLPLRDLTALSEEVRDAELSRWLEEEPHRPFDLATGPLWRGQLLRLGPEEHVLLLTIHHIIFDGWSMGILFKELSTLYTAQVTGQPATLPPLPLQYADFAIWQRQWLQGDMLDRQLTYWRTQLAEAPLYLDLPTDSPRPSQQTYRGDRISFTLPPSLTQELKRLSQQESVTLFMTLLAAFQSLLARYTSQRDILVGTPIAGRTHTELEGLIGFFVNTLVLRTQFKGQPTFRDLLQQVRDTCLDAYSHQDLPFEKLVEALQPVRDPSRHPLIQTMFQVNQADSTVPFTLLGLETTPIRSTSSMARFDLLLALTSLRETLTGSVVFNTDLFAHATMARFTKHFQALLAAIVENPAQPVNQISLLTDPERHQLLVEWNPSVLSDQPAICVHQLFEAQAARTPEAIAVVGGEEQLTYAQLNQRATQLANYLRRQGIGPDVRVGICLERGVDLIVSLLAILKAGGAYVPLDPAVPLARLRFMLEDAEVALVLTSVAHQSLFETWLHPSEISQRTGRQLIALDTEWADWGPKGLPPSCPEVHTENLAYVMYTSGSTGQPKGVEIHHRALTNFLQAMKQSPGLTAQDTLLAVTTLSFDIAGLELYLPLLVGATVVLVSREVAVNGPQFMEQLGSSGATILQATPATWRMLVEAGWQGTPYLKMLCGGEALPRELAEQMLARGGTLWNMYGPTETTIWSAVHHIIEHGQGPVLIGRPIANTQFYVLDPQMHPVPIGVPGELHIGGAGLARGYWGRSTLTAEKFIPNPFSSEEGARLYKTGDLERFRPDGTLEFLGRLDHQVKVRGFRIELGEIETGLEQHPAVVQAVVLAREEAPGNQRLVAYIVSNPESTPTTGELRSFLKAKVPEYMVPSTFVCLNALPLTHNGKVDRQALPAPEATLAEADTFIAPRDALELQLIKIWEGVLGVEPIGMQDDFFELGGHSLLAVRLFAQIEKLTGKRLPLATLFQASTVAHLASVLRQDGWAGSWSSLVPIQPGGSHSPFFCLHAAGGNVLLYRALARHLGSDQPFYGVQAQGMDGSRPLFTQVEEMAAHYLKDIRTLQPQGPYFLGGLCFGGIVAFEMAQQLHAQGQQVALLALLDTAGPGYRRQLLPGASRLRYKVDKWRLRVRHHMGNLQLLGPSEKIAYMVEKIGKKIGLLKTLCLDATVRRWMHRVGASTEPPSQDVLHQLVATNVAAAKRHVLQVYPGTITLFRASKQPLGIVPDPLLGWNGLATEGVEVYEVTGDHLSMLQEPRVQELATQLCECLRQARTAAGSRA